MRPKFLCSDFFLDIFFPNRCASCDAVIEWDKVLCGECEDALEYIEERPWQALFPSEINGEAPFFDAAEALFWYKGAAKDAVLGLKYRKAANFAEYAGERLSEKLDNDIIGVIDLVTAVPMHSSKKKSRGYNQAELIAQSISKHMNIPYKNDILVHKRSSVEQHSLKGDERNKAAEKTYSVKDDGISLDGKCVLICDDVFTTGSTLNKCSGLLKQAGAKRVIAASVVLVKHSSDEVKA
ncbi:MAG: ComF family protein [Oscillospiraceae bacterium]